MINTNYTSSQYGAFYINEFHKNSAKQNYEEYQASENPQKSEDFSPEAKQVFTNLGVDTKLIDEKPQSFFDKIAGSLTRISNLYFNKAPEVELVENSIFQRQWEGTLSEAEKEMYNELMQGWMLVPVSENSELKKIDLAKEEEILLKTTSNFSDFVKAYTELRTNYQEQALKEYEAMFGKEMADNLKQSYANAGDTNSQNANSASTQNTINLTASQSEEKKTFTLIQAESSSETYKDTSGAKNLELTKIEQVKDMLDILFNQKAGDNSALKGLFTTQTRVDIRA